ncbi:hypothetical protein V474_14515 [Novosphingobium barchaimii LL02]|uniref:Uncharacterized protein n=1 Tax=Novosphingobium barchaimii LL02 TaxID=1114963 RepID=A0A0J7XZK2_9SPHN|nr:hypothetical protein V474_14515 [Novosphingobium barchaimii LL02]
MQGKSMPILYAYSHRENFPRPFSLRGGMYVSFPVMTNCDTSFRSVLESFHD